LAHSTLTPDPLYLLCPPHSESRARNPNPVVRERARERKAGGEPATAVTGDEATGDQSDLALLEFARGRVGGVQ